ncbi:MAG: hypothetical protein IT196_26785 [Acidimicrobiales bacterium]|nr:hypothetical protein [Acidimicrobiales bacterium]
MNRFRYHPDVLARYPHVAAAAVTLSGVDNTITPPDLAAEIATHTGAARQRLTETPVAELPSIAAWRRVFTSFGTKPTQYRNAAEALLRRIASGNDLPALNPLTDIANVVSINHAVPVAVLDLDAVHGTVTVRFAEGTEQFHGVGTDEISTPAAGEVIFVDDAGTVHARRWCWRQSHAGATRPSTTDALAIIEAHHRRGQDAVRDAAAALTDLARRHLPGATATVDIGPP